MSKNIDYRQTKDEVIEMLVGLYKNPTFLMGCFNNLHLKDKTSYAIVYDFQFLDVDKIVKKQNKLIN